MKPLRLPKSPNAKSKSTTVVTPDDEQSDPTATATATAAAAARQHYRPDPTCPICQIDIGTKSPEGIREGYAVTPCGHVFGHACIKRYLAITDKPPCPVCRADLFHACSHPVLPAAYDPNPRSSKAPRLSRDEAAKKAFPVEPHASDCAFCRGRRTRIARRMRKRELLEAAARRVSNTSNNNGGGGAASSSSMTAAAAAGTAAAAAAPPPSNLIGGLGGAMSSSSGSSSAASAAGFSVSGSGSGGSASSEGGDEESDQDEGSEESVGGPSRRTRAMRWALTLFHLTGAVVRLTLDAARSRKLKELNSESHTANNSNTTTAGNPGTSNPLAFDNDQYDEDEDDLDDEIDPYTAALIARRNEPPVPGPYGHWDLARKGPDWKFLGWYDQQEPKMKTTAEHFA